MIQKRASLHEKTVQKIARGEVPKPPRKSRTLKAAPPPVTVIDNSAEVAYAKSVVADPSNSYTRWELTPDGVVIR